MKLQIGVVFLAVTMMCCFAVQSSAMSAQTPVPVPVPSEFASAHSVFLAQGGAPAAGRVKLVSNMIYESMYRSITEGKLYTLVGSPVDADLTMEVSVLVTVGTTNNSFNSVSLRLVARDRKTQALLWIFDEPLEGAFREKTFQRNVDAATARIADDLKALSQGQEPKP